LNLLPQNMPKDVLDHFQKVFICKRPMGMTLTQAEAASERPERSERPAGDRKRTDGPRGDKRSGPRKERRPVSFTAK